MFDMPSLPSLFMTLRYFAELQVVKLHIMYFSSSLYCFLPVMSRQNTLSLLSSFTVTQNSTPVNFSFHYCLILHNHFTFQNSHVVLMNCVRPTTFLPLCYNTVQAYQVTKTSRLFNNYVHTRGSFTLHSLTNLLL